MHGQHWRMCGCYVKCPGRRRHPLSTRRALAAVSSSASLPVTRPRRPSHGPTPRPLPLASSLSPLTTSAIVLSPLATRHAAMATPSSSATTPSPRASYLQSSATASTSLVVSNGLLPNEPDDRESLARKITADAHLGEVRFLSFLSLPVSLSPGSPLPASALRVRNGDDCVSTTSCHFFDAFYTRQHLQSLP